MIAATSTLALPQMTLPFGVEIQPAALLVPPGDVGALGEVLDQVLAGAIDPATAAARGSTSRRAPSSAPRAAS